MTASVPTIEQCHFDLFMDHVCHHPDSDDGFNVFGHGLSQVAAYRAMLETLRDKAGDTLPEDEYNTFSSAIDAALATSDRTLELQRKHGRELDALIAEHVFGWKWMVSEAVWCKGLTSIVPPNETGGFLQRRPIEKNEHFERFDDWYRWLPKYSTDIAKAWDVIAQMQKIPNAEIGSVGYWVKIVGPWGPDETEYSVGFDYHGVVACGSSWVQAKDVNCARAICLAALITIEASDDTGHVRRRGEHEQ